MTHEYTVDALLKITAESPEEACAMLGGLASFTAGLIVPVMAGVRRPAEPEPELVDDQAQVARTTFDRIMGSPSA